MANNFLIYNASAGSGKTYTLTRAYLELILAPKKSFTFSRILALTFTNKAVNEMKERILQSLEDFATIPLPKKSQSIFDEVAANLNLTPEDLQKKAQAVLQQILHNFAFFEVSTIDKFNHRLIRTFAKDLKLPQNFEVQLDSNLILEESVSQLLDQVGKDPVLTEIMVAFALEKIADDKSWDLSFDLKNIGGLLFHEHHKKAIAGLKHKKIKDFKALQQQLKDLLETNAAQLKNKAKSLLELIENQGILYSDFSRSSLPNFLKKVAVGISVETSAQWLTHFEDMDPYPKSKPQATKDLIDGIKQELNSGLQLILKQLVTQKNFENAYRNLVPLQLINAIDFQLKTLCEKRDFLPISEFNTLIKQALQKESVPFIYERLGEQYAHYFIDEFQDTSSLQWENLKPLIENALVSQDVGGEKGSLLLVGDAKQAIYRWRGGSAQQFIDLNEDPKNGFSAAPSVTERLPKNFRSNPEIVQFNNRFFSYASKFFSEPSYAALYRENNQQKTYKTKGGFVSLQFLNAEKDTKTQAYCEEVLAVIKEAQEKGHELEDICVLCRKNTEGFEIATYLMEANIPVISSESLQLASHPKIQFLIALIRRFHEGAKSYLEYPLLLFLAEQQTEVSTHVFIHSNLTKSMQLFKNKYGFDSSKLDTQDIYELCVQAIRCFNLSDGKDAYLLFFLDVVLEVSEKRGGGGAAFLSYWEEKKDHLSIGASEGTNAVQILSIHKSKGLEFPIVIYPFVETPIYDEKKPKLWVPVPKEVFCGFEYLLFNKNEDLTAFSEAAKELVAGENRQLELDAFNLLYVAFTRAEKALFVIGSLAFNTKGELNTKQYSGVLIDYLMHENLWNASQLQYHFGQFEPALGKSKSNSLFELSYNQTVTRDNYGLLPHPMTTKTKATLASQKKGQQLHLLLEHLDQLEMEVALQKVLRIFPMAPISELKANALAILNHPKLHAFYKKDIQAANEMEIFGQDGMSYRPDRLVFETQSVSIIDYKTGKEKQEDYNQINHYGALLSEMGYQVKNKILVYISTDQIDPIFVR